MKSHPDEILKYTHPTRVATDGNEMMLALFREKNDLACKMDFFSLQMVPTRVLGGSTAVARCERICF